MYTIIINDKFLRDCLIVIHTFNTGEIMGKVPVKPNFIKEYDAEKELQQSIADKEQKKAKNDQPANKISKKLLIPIITGVLLLFIVGGAFVLNSKTNIFNNKQKNKSASQVSDISKQVAEEKENSGDGIYQKEADALWNIYGIHGMVVECAA